LNDQRLAEIFDITLGNVRKIRCKWNKKQKDGKLPPEFHG